MVGGAHTTALIYADKAERIALTGEGILDGNGTALLQRRAPHKISPSTRALEHKVQVQKRKTAMMAPAQAKRITAIGPAKFVLPDMPAMVPGASLTPNLMAGAGGAGSLPGLGSFAGGGGGGGGPGINFFGLRTNARRIAFLLDYSDSMSGPF